jgi:hypothetical protein
MQTKSLLNFYGCKTFLYKFIVLIITTLCLSPSASAQNKFTRASIQKDNTDCIPYLKNGLSDEYKSTNNVSLFEDSKQYFSSDQFEHDYKAGKWNGGIAGMTNIGPISLNAESSESAVHEFRLKVARSSSFKLSLQTYNTISKSTLRSDIAEAYNNCLNGKYGFDFAVEGTKVVTITITCKKLEDGDPIRTVESADIAGIEESDRSRILRTVLAKGKPISKVTFIAHRKPNEDLVIAITAANNLGAGSKRFSA